MIPTNARKKFKTDVVPSDRQLWAIGMVVVRWSLIEQLVTANVHSFTDENDKNDPVRKLFDSTRSMQQRLDQWEELSRLHLQASWLAPMLNIINEVRQILDMRDKIVHGTWSDKENSNTISTEAHGPFSWGKPGHAFSWKLDYHGILNVALRIDRLQTSMFEFALRASGVGNSGATLPLAPHCGVYRTHQITLRHVAPICALFFPLARRRDPGKHHHGRDLILDHFRFAPLWTEYFSAALSNLGI